jgi:stage II sporulation protein AB (anti-sigma F factor)
MDDLINKMELIILAKRGAESFARSTVTAFAVELNPSLEEVNDIKTAVSEAVTNSIIHAYPENFEGEKEIYITAEIFKDSVVIGVRDKGIGIDDLDRALTPFYSSKSAHERSGIGFTVMRAFMSELSVASEAGSGTVVTMKKNII